MVNLKPHWSNHACGYGHDELADYFYSKGRLDEAAKEREKALSFSDNPRYFAKLSKIYYEKGLYSKAISVAEKAVGVHPENPGLHNNLGILYEEKKLYNKALQEYKKALVIEPRFAPAHANFGRLSKNSYQQFIKNLTENPECKKKGIK